MASSRGKISRPRGRDVRLSWDRHDPPCGPGLNVLILRLRLEPELPGRNGTCNPGRIHTSSPPLVRDDPLDDPTVAYPFRALERSSWAASMSAFARMSFRRRSFGRDSAAFSCARRESS